MAGGIIRRRRSARCATGPSSARRCAVIARRNSGCTATRCRRSEKPDVIIAPSSDVVPALPDVLRRAGLRIPEDIGLAVLACPEPGSPFSGVYQNGKMIGALAIDTLTSLVERHERGLPEQATTLMVEGQWNEGTTLRAAP